MQYFLEFFFLKNYKVGRMERFKDSPMSYLQITKYSDGSLKSLHTADCLQSKKLTGWFSLN